VIAVASDCISEFPWKRRPFPRVWELSDGESRLENNRDRLKNPLVAGGFLGQTDFELILRFPMGNFHSLTY
jgi:hypothetical protein